MPNEKPTPCRLATAALALVAALAVGCGDSDGSASTAEPTPESTTNITSDPGEEPTGPLFAFLGMGTGSQMNDMIGELEMRVQTLTKQCMLEQGFEYQAHVPEDAFGRDGRGAHQWDRTWAEQNGYGFAPVLFGGDDTSVDSDGDPNEAHLATLGEAAAESWQTALWGTPDQDGPGDTPGCLDQSEREVFAFFDTLDTAYQDYLDRVAADPLTLTLDAAWAGCMAGSGFDYRNPEDLLDAVADNFNSVSPQLQIGLHPDGSVDISGDDRSSFTPDPDAVAMAQDEEIRIALADFDCSLAERDARREVDFRHQQQMVDENREALSEFNN